MLSEKGDGKMAKTGFIGSAKKKRDLKRRLAAVAYYATHIILWLAVTYVVMWVANYLEMVR